MEEINQAIRKVETLYRSLTGADAPPADTAYAPIPPEQDPIKHVEDQVERLLGMLDRTQPARGMEMCWSPMASAWEGPKEVVIQMELAGVPREALQVSVTQNLLTVAGQRPMPALGGEEWKPRLMERPYGNFRRVVALPQGAQAEQMTAHMREGLLEIRIPVAAGAGLATQTIPVK